MGLFGILLGLALLVWLAYRGWSILLLAPGAALIAAAFAGGPTLPYWTQTFMDNASRFIAQFFPLFLLGALFGKLMEDSGSVAAIASFMTEKLGPQRAILTSCWPARWLLMAASACLLRSLCWCRWRRPCSALRGFPID